MGKVLPILIVLIFALGGAGAGFALKPKPVEDGKASAEPMHAEAKETSEDLPPIETGEWEYVKLDKQFVVPVVSEAGVASLMLLAISLEVKPGQEEAIYAKEPKIRDRFLSVLFQHANSGGFDGHFTDRRQLKDVRANLRRAARGLFGETINDVLLTDIIRQDL